jgi:hypothetical protein
MSAKRSLEGRMCLLPHEEHCIDSPFDRNDSVRGA